MEFARPAIAICRYHKRKQHHILRRLSKVKLSQDTLPRLAPALLAEGSGSPRMAATVLTSKMPSTVLANFPWRCPRETTSQTIFSFVPRAAHSTKAKQQGP